MHLSFIPCILAGFRFICFSLFQVYYYYPFSAVSDPAKLYNDLRWNVTRPQGFEAVMRVRCSQVLSFGVLIFLWPLLLLGI